MARKRYQRGALQLRGGARKRWALVWREDVVDPKTGAVDRVQRVTHVGMLDDYPTKPLARRRADAILAAAGVNDLNYRPRASMTFRETAELWKSQMLIHQKAGTQMKAEDHLRAHLLPAFGALPMDAIGTFEVQRLVTTLAQRMKSKSIANVIGTLGKVNAAAKAWGLTPSPWHRDDLLIPKDKTPKTSRAFTVAEVRAILQAARQPWAPVFALAALAALRGGEILGLHWADVDLEAEQVRILWAVGPRRTLQSVKSTKSERTVPLVPVLVDILRDYRERYWTPNPEGLLFATKTRRPLSHTKVLEDRLWPLLEALKIEQRGLHAFRHTAASLLIEEGVPLPLVQQIMGHEDLKTTLGIYAHVIRPEHRAAMQKLSDLFCDLVVTSQNRKSLVQ